MKFYLLNVFTKNQTAGNQLAVVFPTTELSSEKMQSITREFGFSETVFITHPHEIPEIRIFTPGSEIPFAGHPLVGSTWLLRFLSYQKEDFKLKVKIGEVPVRASETNAIISF